MNESQMKKSRRSVAPVAVAAVVWFCAAVGSMTALAAYSNSPGPADPVPVSWPVDTHIIRGDGEATLLLFAHPHCPCTRATLAELARLAADCDGQLATQVWFLKPAGTGADWAETDLWQTAAGIPGVTVHVDDNGAEARRFHATTSGETVLYDEEGRLLFRGGITLSRGHEGDNPGRSAIAGLVQHGSAPRSGTPTFGCPLFEGECRPQGGTSPSPRSKT